MSQSAQESSVFQAPRTVSPGRHSSIRSGASVPPIGGNSIGEYFQRLLNRPDQLYPLLALIALIVLLVCPLVGAYWNSLEITGAAWRSDSLYSHGYLIPLFAFVLLLMRRKPFEPVEMAERWAGVGVILFGLLLRNLAAAYHTTTIDSPTLVICLLGSFLLVGGWSALRWAGPAVGFLIFMYPVPIFIKDTVLQKLQSLATLASTWLLQTMSVMAFREGNRIQILDNPLNSGGDVSADPIFLNVIDACSGLRMLTIFVALAVAIVMVTDRPWWDRLIILLSSVPIAILVNVIRITVTAFLFIWAGEQEWVKTFSHNGAGLFMMPLALGFLCLELEILSRLVIKDEGAKPVGVGGHGTHVPVTS